MDSVSPTDGATDIALDSNVTATFADLAINADTVTNESFALTKDGSPVAAHVSYDFDGEGFEKATLVPGSALEANTTYTATITTSVKDLAGHALGQDYSWTFTTTDDATAPSTTPALSPQPNAAGWNKANVTVTLSATDDDSGVKELTYAATGAQPIAEQTVQGGSATLPTITTEGETTITYHATDNAGNAEAEQTFTVKLDKRAPTSSASAAVPDGSDAGSDPDPYTSNTWTNQNVTLAFSADDGSGSGVNKTYYKGVNGVTDWTQVPSGGITVSAEGVNTVQYYSDDALGNAESPAKTFTVKLDKSAPTSSASAKDSAGNSYTSGTLTNKDVTLALSAADGSLGSGVKEISYSINNGATKTYNPTQKIVISSEGESTISYYATDNAGNQESPPKTFKVKLDKSAPTLEGTTPGNGATGVSRGVKPEATFSDAMDLASLKTSVKLYQRKSGKWRLLRGTDVSCVDDSCHTARLDPYPTADTNLAANKKYKVVVTTGAKNLAGISLSSNKSSTFTTGP